MQRRWYATLGTVCALLAAGAATGTVLVSSGTSAAAPTKEEYFARVAAICRIYGPKLNKVAPPSDIAIPGVVASSVGRALPLIEAQAAVVHALRPPKELQAKIKRWIRLDNRAIRKLRESLRLAREPNISLLGVTYVEFLRASIAAKKVGGTIGFPHPPC